MTGTLVKLTIIVPAGLENMLVETLLEMEPSLGAFSTVHAEGHGQSFDEASIAERVSGRAARLMVFAIVERERAKSVIDRLKAILRVPHAVWWTEPVHEFGRFQ